MHLDVAVLCKITSLVIFFPMFVGIAVWAFWPKNKAHFEALAAQALAED